MAKQPSEKLHNLRHSLAHILASAVQEMFPKAQLGVGPVIEHGFFYDFLLPRSLTPEDLARIEKRMRELVKQKLPFERQDMSIHEAKTFFDHSLQPFKVELIKDIEKFGTTKADEILNSETKLESEKKSDAKIDKVSLYKTGKFIDLCRGGHVGNTAEIDPQSFKLNKMSGAYWRGDQKNSQMQRIYGLAFESKEKLDEYLKSQEEMLKRDHKKLGPELDLYFIDEKVGKGLPMWTPKGTAAKFELEKFTRDLERKYGYEHVTTPYLGAEELYRTSGHLSHYSQNMYAPIDMDGDKFYLRPMACPHHIRMFQRKPWSYKDLPVRYAEIADYNRYEKSGELMGLIRVRKFQLTDGHLFVTPEGLKDEFKLVCKMIIEGIKGLGLSSIVSYRFSRRDPANKEKYYPDDALWNKAESMMKKALDELKISYTEALDEAAFYGPKLDVQARNVNGKEDTLYTAQIDFLLPEKFNIEYIAQDGSKKRPVMIHRSTIGSLERIFAFLIEHYAGAFPVWLSPVQVKLLPITDKQNKYAKSVYKELAEAGIRVELDDRSESVGKKIREAEMEKVPYMFIIGEKEEKAKKVAIRGRNQKDLGVMKLDKFTKQILEEIKNRI